MKIKRIGTVSLTMILAIIGFVTALDSPQYDSVFAVLPIGADAELDDTYRQLFGELIRFELSNAGLHVHDSDNLTALTASDLIGSIGDVDELAVLEIGEEEAADFVLTCLFSKNGTRMQITFTCFDVGEKQTVTSVSSNVLPYVLGTPGTSVALSGAYGLSLEFSYAVFFEPDYPIMGYMPGLSFYISG